jgi:hypothetical protein
MLFLDPFLGAIAYGAEVRAALAQPGRHVANVAPSSAPRSMAPSSILKPQSTSSSVGTAQDFNLVVMGSSPTMVD